MIDSMAVWSVLYFRLLHLLFIVDKPQRLQQMQEDCKVRHYTVTK